MTLHFLYLERGIKNLNFGSMYFFFSKFHQEAPKTKIQIKVRWIAGIENYPTDALITPFIGNGDSIFP